MLLHFVNTFASVKTVAPLLVSGFLLLLNVDICTNNLFILLGGRGGGDRAKLPCIYPKVKIFEIIISHPHLLDK